ncbi:hypothetical protein IIV22A_113R [Invertebrate iridescent virus 22]|uniref:Nonstructural protein WIV domain-containing protein n=1 Tax=Invertebrate iridescent virus 22 TaxID=345198 RepID=S6DDR4_9VIRU|nr:hypothetical protein IIV22_107R [Invertebrate iridescent virus 22]YP_009010874.1 hypothetical protein IIV22A_113R [Invertebrate iridescent virus 22]CCV01784.1 hypothetical protein IIV22_107R [Invertebrate iridescent virus 22]CCV01957.1 hypothetical protein IIV22A_113R [Invertebrate iridescent virus 22]
MGKEIENFVTYSLRYQLLLAQHIASICNTKIYVFDKNGYFDSKDDTKVEVIDGVRTVSKNSLRAVLSVAVKESFGSNEDLFLQYVDKGVVQKDDTGLYVVKQEVSEEKQESPNKDSEVSEEKQESPNKDSEVSEEKQESPNKDSEVSEIDLKDISDAVERVESII